MKDGRAATGRGGADQGPSICTSQLVLPTCCNCHQGAPGECGSACGISGGGSGEGWWRDTGINGGGSEPPCK